MRPARINGDEPHPWKSDIAAPIDQFHQWFMRFAPEAFRPTRAKTTQPFKAALLATNDFRGLTPDTFRSNPGGRCQRSECLRRRLSRLNAQGALLDRIHARRLTRYESVPNQAVLG